MRGCFLQAQCGRKKGRLVGHASRPCQLLPDCPSRTEDCAISREEFDDKGWRYAAEEARMLAPDGDDGGMRPLGPGEGAERPGFVGALTDSLRKLTAR